MEQQKKKGEELRLLREKTKETFWIDDLNELLAELDKIFTINLVPMAVACIDI